MEKFAGNFTSIDSKNTYTQSLGSDEFNEFSLGKNTSKILYNDPKLLLFTLARYKFVAKMFAGFNSVLEVGCQEGFGAIIISQAVNQLHAIDFFIPHIDSCIRRIKRKNITFAAADILEAPIKESYQGLFALDVLEHIEPKNEDLFMSNVCGSISPDGVVIIGMPSLQSQKYASEASKIGHVNCKTGDQLLAFSRKYFKNVFSFSMNDEVLHTGFFPMSHYLFVICTNKISSN